MKPACARSIFVSRRRSLKLGAGLAAGIALPSLAAAQALSIRPKLSPSIAMVTWRGETDVEKGFRDYIRANGWTPQIVTLDAAQDRTKLQTIAAELTRRKPDLVYSWGTPATLGLVGTIDQPDPLFATQIPHVFALVADPTGVKLTREPTRPERKITGVSHVPPARAQWQAMNSYLPTKRVAMVYNRAEPNSVASIREWEALAKKEGFAVDARPFAVTDANVTTVVGIEAILADMKERRADWLVLGPDTFLFSNLETVAQAALAQRLPTFASTESQIAAKFPVLAGLVSKFLHVGQFAGLKAQQMLSRTTDAQAVPIETLKRFAYVVRVSTAKQLGVLPPMALMDYAEFR
jgi:putative tryptophan/tyrosine transport system substrate-binding protein